MSDESPRPKPNTFSAIKRLVSRSRTRSTRAPRPRPSVLICSSLRVIGPSSASACTVRGLSSLITNTLCRLCYQAPFPYRATASAVWAAYCRRKALRLLTEYWFGVPCVADALYVRWDAESKAFVLGTEYIAGRGPRLSPPDPYLVQRWLGGRALPPRPIDDMDTLVAFMDQLRSLLQESGFTGTQWQV